MRLHSVTVPQNPEKAELASFFYGNILRLPHQLDMGGHTHRWFKAPVFLAVQPMEPTEFDPEPWGGFTGIQLNVVPAKDLNPIVAYLRATGTKQPEPKELPDQRLMSVYDPSDNSLLLVGTDERPTEPLIEESVGSLTVFVSDIAEARTFYVDGLGLPVRAEPFEGLIVLGEETGTALFIYQVPEDSEKTPIGRDTGLALADPDPAAALVAIEKHGGLVLDRADAPSSNGGEPSLRAARFTDPEGNAFTLLSEAHLVEPQAPGEDEEDGGNGFDPDADVTGSDDFDRAADTEASEADSDDNGNPDDDEPDSGANGSSDTH
jgi:catechol 2,3-dioxygenase-like lactoylglutathione lyase family enzyme